MLFILIMEGFGVNLGMMGFMVVMVEFWNFIVVGLRCDGLFNSLVCLFVCFFIKVMGFCIELVLYIKVFFSFNFLRYVVVFFGVR